MRLHWHRDDLRASDNRALSAGDTDGIVPVFVFDDAVLSYGSPPRVAFMLDALSSLRAWYRDRDSDLVVARGDPRQVLPELASRHGADTVSWSRGYSGMARRRDDAVAGALHEAGVDHAVRDDALLHEPGSILTNDGDPYSVYSYFWKKWRDRTKDDPVDVPESDALADVSGDPLPSLSDLGFDDPSADLLSAGTEAARDRLTSFCEDDVYRYADRRDYPAAECTSRLSQDLRWGTIGVREVYEETAAAKAFADAEAARESVTAFQRQLAWREFYHHVLYHDPDVVTENYTEYTNPIAWRNDPDELQAWKDGETGFPIVDAGMRQLLDEGYVHNRVRMVAASFLTKDLLVDWRHGYAHYRDHLVDHDPANDSGGWQWAASTGTDAQPYFRIFNPTTQGERYDPDAEYITSYVPELRDATPAEVHGWPDLTDEERAEAAPEYPAPIVDHGERRELALSTFEAARGR